MRERLYLFDTTLRDGAQMNGVDFTLADKVAIARMLDTIGIDYIEGGYPGANPIDTELFGEKRKLAATFTAFGMTRRPGRSAANDPGLGALLEAQAGAICFVAKASDLASSSAARPGSFEVGRPGRRAMPNAVKVALSPRSCANSCVSVRFAPG